MDLAGVYIPMIHDAPKVEKVRSGGSEGKLGTDRFGVARPSGSPDAPKPLKLGAHPDLFRTVVL